MRRLAFLAAVFAAATFGLAGVAKADTTAFGPLEYLCFDTATTTAVGDCDGKDSPFADLDFSGGYFHLWTFETGSIGTPSVPGVTLVGTALSIHCGPTSTDSVDEDDGFIDGSGNDGCSLFDSPGTDGITFEFDETTLGMFPTHIGIVWTDGLNDAGFDVLDESGSAIDCAPTETTTGTFDGFNGDTDEDRFFGCFNDSGISEFTIKMVGNLGTGIEVDHLQYGKIPELEPEASLTKVLTSGPDGDETPPFDLAVQIGQLVTSHYDFTITYEPNGDTTPVVVLDTLPAEWVVDEVEGTSTASLAPRSPVLDIPDLDGGTGSVDVSKNGKGAKSKSATSLAWTPDPTIATSDIRVDATTRQSPGKKEREIRPDVMWPVGPERRCNRVRGRSANRRARSAAGR